MNNHQRISAIANQKGGVGKTSTAINLGSALAESGHKVLLVDLDPQFNCTAGLGIDPSEDQSIKTIYDLLQDTSLDPGETILQTNLENVDLIPSCLDLAGAELQLPQMVGAEKLLQESVRKISGYDFILIDCPPSLGRLTLNALTAASEVLIPIQIGKWSLTGTGQLLETIDLVKQRLNRDLKIVGVLCTMFDTRTSLSHEILARIQEEFGELTFNTTIKTATKVGEAAVADTSVLNYAKNSSVAQSYRELAEEFIKR